MARRARPVAARVLGTSRRSRAALLLGTALQTTFLTVIAFPTYAQPAPNARPQGGQVVAGSATITAAAKTTTIDQSSQRAAVDWRSFDVGSQQSVQFNQPSSGAITLNRVTGPDPSAIAGKVTANGQIILTNPSGVTFYKGAQVNAQSVVVSAPGITNDNFMAGHMVFDQAAKPGARIVNEGTITVKEAGLAGLVAPQVANSGTINAKLGHVVLAGAEAHTVDLYGDGLVSIDVTKQVTTAPDGGAALVTNRGLIRAEGGTVKLTAAAADGLVQTLVDAGGTIATKTTSGKTGRIVISGTGGDVVISGQLDATAEEAGQGGRVQVMSDHGAILAKGGTIDVSGAAGGGQVAFGTTLGRGRLGAADTTARKAARAIIEAGATIKANALKQGRGGRVTVLSGSLTSVGGTITARGGPQGGNGGQVEISGGGDVRFGESVGIDVSAILGKPGTITLDPFDLTISNAGSYVPAHSTAPQVGYNNPNTTSNVVISPSTLNQFSGSVSLQAVDNITVASSVNITPNLTLAAGNSVTVNSGVTVNTGSGTAIGIIAGSTAIPSFKATGSIVVSGSLVAAGNSVINLTSGSAGGITLNGASVASGGNGATLTAGTGGVTLTGATIVNSGFTAIRSQGAVAADAASTITTTSLYAGASALSLPGANQIGTISGINVRNGVTVNNAGDLAVAGVTGNSANLATNGVTLSSSGGSLNLLAGGTVANIVTAYNGALRLTALGSIAQSGNAGLIAATLTGSGGTGSLRSAPTPVVTLTGNANTIATLGNFTAPNGFAFSQSSTGALVIGGTVTVANGGLSVGTGGSLSIAAGGTLASAQSVNVTAVGALAENAAGVIKAGTLSGSASAISLPGANSIASVGALTASSGPLLLADSAALSVNGTMQVASGQTLSIDADRLSLANGYLVARGGMVDLAPYTPNTPVLVYNSGSAAASGLSLQASSVFGHVTTGTLAVGNAVTSGITIGNAGDTIVLAGSFASTLGLFTNTSGTAALGANAALSIGTLVGNVGSLDLSNDTANTILNLGSLTAATGIVIGQASSLTISGPVSAGSTIEIETSTSNMTVAGNLTAPGILLDPGGTLNLVSGTISGSGSVGVYGEPVLQSGGAIIAGTLNASGSTISLAGSFNTIGTIGFLEASGGPITFADTSGVVIAGNVTTNGDESFSNAPVSLRIGGALTEGPDGFIAAYTLSGSAASVSLTSNNYITDLGTFTSTGGFALSNAQPFTVLGPVSDSAGITLSSVGRLTLAGNLTAPAIGLTAHNQSYGGTVYSYGAIAQIAGSVNASGLLSLIADGSVTQSGTLGGGAMLAGTLTGGAAGVTLFGPSNSIAVLGSFASSAGFALADARSLTVGGAVSDPPTVTLAVVGDLAVTNGITAPAVQLTATGAITEPAGGSIATSTLTGSAANVALTQIANSIASIGSFTSAGAFALTDGASLAINGTVSVGSGNTLTINDSNIGFNRGGRLSAPGGLVVIAPTTPNTAFYPPTTLGSGTYVNANVLQLGYAAGGTFTFGGSFALPNVPTLDLEFGGLVTETSSGVISVANLVGNTGTLSLTGNNSIGNLGSFVSTGGLTLANVNSLTVGGPVSDATSVAISSSGALTIAGNVTAPRISLTAAPSGYNSGTGVLIQNSGLIGSPGATSTVVLNAGVNILQNGGSISAAVLTGSAGGGAYLTSATNTIAALGSFAVQNGLSLADAASLSVTGLVSAGSIGLIVPAGIGETAAGIVNTPTLYGSGGTIALTGTNNVVGTLVNFAASGNFALTDSIGLDVTGTVTVPTGGTIALADNAPSFYPGALLSAPGGRVILAPGSAGSPITLNAALGTASYVTATTLQIGNTAAGSIAINGAFNLTNAATLDLESGAAVRESGSGALIVANLTGHAAGASLSGNNRITSLGSFATTNGFSLYDGGNLTVAGPVSDTTTGVTLTTLGNMNLTGGVAGPTITLSASGGILQSAGTVAATGVASLVSSGTIAQSGGAIDAGTLDITQGGSAGITLMSAANSITSIGTISGAGGLSLVDATNLTVAGYVSEGQALVSLAAPNITISGYVVGGGTLSLASAGSIVAPGNLNVGHLTGTAASASFAGPLNYITELDGFTTTNGFTLSNHSGLSVAGPVTDGTGISLTAQRSLTLAGTVSAPNVSLTAATTVPRRGSVTYPGVLSLASGLVSASNQATLNATSSIVQAAGSIITPLLTGTAGAGATLTNTNNLITALGSFATGAGLSLADARALAINGSVTGPSVTLAVNGSLTESGQITTGQFGGGAASVTLATANTITNLGSFTTTNDFLLTDAVAATVANTISVGSGHTLTLNDDAPHFVAGGALVAPAGRVVLAPGTAGDAITLNAATGTASYVTATTLQIGNTSAGALSINSPFNLTNAATLALVSGAGITEGSGGALTVANLTGQGASATLTGANSIANLGSFTTTGSLALSNAAALTVNGPVSGSNVALSTTMGTLGVAGTVNGTAAVTLAAAGSIAQSGGAIVTPSLSVTQSAAGATLTGSLNAVGTLASASGNYLVFVDSQPLTTVAVSETGLARLTAPGLTLGGIAVGTLDVEGGAVAQAGAVSAGTLTGTVTGASLVNAGNAIGTLGTFTSSNGLTIADNGLVVTGPVTDATGITLTSAGLLNVAGSVTAPVVDLVASTRNIGSASNAGTLLQSSGIIAGTTAVTLASSGSIAQTAGSIVTPLLTGASTLATSLSQPGNSIATLGSFSAGTSFALADASALSLTGLLSAPSVSLNGGAITEASTGVISAGTFAGSAASATLAGANTIATLGSVSISSGDFLLRDVAPLTIANFGLVGIGHTLTIEDDTPIFASGAALFAPLGKVALAPATAGDPITLSAALGSTGAITASTLQIGNSTAGSITIGGTFNLTNASVLDLESAASITEVNGGVLVAPALTGHAASASLTGANTIGSLGAFAVTGSLALNDSTSLTVNGPVSGANVSLATGGDLNLPSFYVNATSALALAAVGSIGQQGGYLAAPTLTLTAGNGITLLNAQSGIRGGGNLVSTLAGAYSAAGNILFDAGLFLNVTGPVNAAQGNVGLYSGLTAPLNLASTVTGRTVNLQALSTIIESAGGSVVANTLNAAAGGTISLTGGNTVATLGTVLAFNFNFADSEALRVAGPVNVTGAATLAAAGPLLVTGNLAAPSLTLSANGLGGNIVQTGGTISAANTALLIAAGSIAQSGGVFTAGTLSAQATNAISLAGSNAITTLGGISATTLALADNAALTVAGPVSASSVNLADPAGITLAGPLSTSTLTVTTAGSVIQTTGTITVGLLTGSAGTLARFGPDDPGPVANVSTLGAFSVPNGTLDLASNTPLTVIGPISAYDLLISAPSRITLAGSSIATQGAPVSQQLGATPAASGSSISVLPGSDGTGTLAQTGTTTITALGTSPNTLRLDAPNAGQISLNNLSARQTNLVLASQGGTIMGNIDVASLSVLGQSGTAALTGSVAGTTGSGAAPISAISPAVNVAYTINGCVIDTTCGALPSATAVTLFPNLFPTLEIPGLVLETNLLGGDSQAIATAAARVRVTMLFGGMISFTQPRDIEDPDVLLPNISDRDY